MNSLELILEELASVNLISIYHSSDNPNLNGVMASDDFVPGIFGAGTMHGPGFYSVWRKEDLNYYGDYFYKGYVNFKNSKILILDPEFYKEIYKKERPDSFLKSQLEQLKWKYFGDEEISYFFKLILENPENNSVILKKMEEKVDVSSFFDGVAYYGKKDGHCLLMWNYRKVKISSKKNEKTGKWEINSKDYISQKKNKINNFSLYKKGNAKIVERDNCYLFFEGKEKITNISRDQKNYFNLSTNIRKIKSFFKKNNIPEAIFNRLTFTDGTKISIENLNKILEKRGSYANNDYRYNDLELDIENEEFYNTLKYCKSEKSSILFANNFIDTLYNFYNKNKDLCTKQIAPQIKGKPLTISDFCQFPPFIENRKETTFDCERQDYFPDSRNTNGYYYYFKKSLPFKGKIINYSKNKMKIDFETAVDFFMKENGSLDLREVFKETKSIVVTFKHEDEFNPDLKSITGVIFENPDFNLLSNLKTLFPCFMLYDSANKKFVSIDLSFATKIILGMKSSLWKFPEITKTVYLNSLLPKKTVDILKKRNPKIEFKIRKK